MLNWLENLPLLVFIVGEYALLVICGALMLGPRMTKLTWGEKSVPRDSYRWVVAFVLFFLLFPAMLLLALLLHFPLRALGRRGTIVSEDGTTSVLLEAEAFKKPAP